MIWRMPSGRGIPAQHTADRESGTADRQATAARRTSAAERVARIRQTGRGPEPWLPVEASEVLLVTAFDFLRAEVERIVAAAGGSLRVVADVAEAAPYWDSAAAVLVGSDVRDLPPRRRAPSVLVGLSGEGDSLVALGSCPWRATRGRPPRRRCVARRVPQPLTLTGGRRGGPRRNRRLRRCRSHHGGDLACPGGCGPRRKGFAGRRRPLGRRARTRLGGRGITGPSLAGSVGCQWQHRPRAARGRPAHGRRVFVSVVARHKGKAAGCRLRQRWRRTRRRTAGLRAGHRRHWRGMANRCGLLPGTVTAC